MPEKELSIEERIFLFEKEKYEKEQARQDELHKRAMRQINLSPTVVTLIAAIIGLLGTMLGATLKGTADAKLENERLRSELILKAVDTRDKNEAAKFLKFLKDVGLVSGLNEIDNYINNPDEIPLRPQDFKPILKLEAERARAAFKQIAELLAKGEIDKDQARILIEMQKNSFRQVILAISDMSLIDAEKFIADELENNKNIMQKDMPNKANPADAKSRAAD